MVMSGPKFYTLKCTTIDPLGTGEAVNTSYKMTVHAPLEQPTVTFGPEYQLEKCYAQTVHNTTSDNIDVTLQVSQSASDTTTYSADVSIPLWGVITGKVGAQHSSSETFAASTSVKFVLHPGLYGRWAVFGKYRNFTLFGQAYSGDGYDSPSNGSGVGPITNDLSEYILTPEISLTPF